MSAPASSQRYVGDATAAPRACPAASSLVWWGASVALISLLTACLLFSVLFVLAQEPDFEYFYRAGESTARHGFIDPGYDMIDGRVVLRGRLDWYLPAVHRMLSLLGEFDFRTAGLAWVALNAACVIATLVLLARHFSGLPVRDWPVTQIGPFVLLLPYWFWELRLNQIDALTLALLVGGYATWRAGKSTAAGFWLGLAALLKLTPGLVVVWFAMKRQWRVVAAAALTVALAGPVSDTIAFGWPLVAEEHRGWLTRAVDDGSPAAFIRNGRELDWRNQALGATLARRLTATSYATRFDNDPRVARDYANVAPAYIHLATLSRDTAARAAQSAALASLAALLWLARRRLSPGDEWTPRLEFSLFLLAMLWLMPVMRFYHMIWAMPAVSTLMGLMHHVGRRAAWSRLAAACLLLVLLSHATLLSTRWQAMSPALLSVALLTTPIVAALLHLRRDPQWVNGAASAARPRHSAAGAPPAVALAAAADA